jgi:hypothetical protein
MHVLAIDAGSYSVKYLSSIVDRRKITHTEMSEIVLRDYMIDHPELSADESVNNIVRDILDNIAKPDTKIIFQSDPRMMTTRFLTLTVKSKKKADTVPSPKDPKKEEIKPKATLNKPENKKADEKGKGKTANDY